MFLKEEVKNETKGISGYLKEWMGDQSWIHNMNGNAQNKIENSWPAAKVNRKKNWKVSSLVLTVQVSSPNGNSNKTANELEIGDVCLSFTLLWGITYVSSFTLPEMRFSTIFWNAYTPSLLFCAKCYWGGLFVMEHWIPLLGIASNTIVSPS